MAMQKHFDPPGSPAWTARRAGSFNAGDASAALGCHPSGKTRTQLLHELHTGIQREFSDYVQERVIDPGHRIEALWRPIAEEILGEDLQVIAVSLDVGLSRPLGASLDGITFMEDRIGECKSANEALRAALPHSGRDSHARNDARQLPKGYRVQCEQQQLVTGATITLFSACLFDAAGNPTEERHCWYRSDPELRREILAGWKQLDADLAAYEPPAAAAPAPVGRAPEALPALRIEVTGAVTASNLAEFKAHALEVFRGINRTLTTDTEFADAEKAIKWCGEVEDRLKAAKQHALSQTETIDAMFRAIDEIGAEARAVRLELDKLVKAEKERRKGEIVAAGVGALQRHIAELNASLGRPLMPTIPADFGGAIKGLRSLASMEDAVSTALARAKIAAGEAFQRIHTNLNTLRQYDEHKHLFPDTGAIVLKAPEDLQALVQARIAQHREAEERRLEQERERIRAEEEAKARAAAAREQQEREAQQRRPAAPAVESSYGTTPEAPAAVMVSNVLTIPTKPAEAVAISAPSLRLGQINERLSPLSIDAAGLAYLGFPPVGKEGAAKMYREESFPMMVDAIVSHLQRSKLKRREVA